LYFEELSYERVMDIYELEHASSAVVSFGGQLPQNIALKLQEVGGAKILGTNPLVSNLLLPRFMEFRVLLTATTGH
jgi:carbamoyl-phosphate synthase large subunit